MAIVVGYADTDEGEAALTRATEEARTRGGPLLVVNTTRAGAPDQHDEELPRVRGRLQEAGVAHEVMQPSPTPDPAEDILAAALSSGAELIVIGLRRRTPVGKLLLGSHAQRILLEAPCPVLAVKFTP